MSDVPIPHRREFTRVEVHPVIDLTVGGRPVTDARVGNLSLRGVLVLSAERPAAEMACSVTIRLGGTAADVAATGRVGRTTPVGCAIQFTEILGLDSLEHLRNLIRYNSHNPNEVEQEFRNHLGLEADV
ncbi:MAG TPA: PilZ domain-containing protein [Gemmatimonadales bacterium]|nr:PilZ domain-containing protein [Gemmatimonadales bacterium]